MRKIYIVLLLSCWSTLLLKAQTPSFVADSLDRFIQQGMRDWQIPGLAIAIVKDGKIVWMKGYGERNIQTHEPVDEQTLFMIASNSKLFTGTALAQLETQGKLSLNDPILRFLPDFKLYDETSTKLVTIRDMLSHRIGTGTFQGDFTFWNGKLSRTEIMQKMRLLKPTGLFRQDFGYCNSCFLTAGEVIPRVTGKPWEVYVYDSIIVPAGLKNTHTLGTGIDQRTNVSKPYTTAYSGTIQPIPYDQVDNLGPAGSMVSNVKDLARWMMLQLDSGRLDGKQVIPWSVIRKTRAINTAISSNKSSSLPTHFTGYGLGLFQTDYNGQQVYWHTGGAFGFVTNTCFVPESKLGIVVLTNNDNQQFFEMLRYQLLDAYLQVPYTNRSAMAFQQHQISMQKTIAQIKSWQSRIQGTAPPLPLNSYTGKYQHPLYGTIELSVKDNGLFIQFNGHRNLTATLQYMDKGEWLLQYNNIAYGIFATHFTMEQQMVKGIDIKANDFVEYDAYHFVKQ